MVESGTSVEWIVQRHETSLPLGVTKAACNTGAVESSQPRTSTARGLVLSVMLSVGDGNARRRCRRLPAGGLGRRTMNWLSVNDLTSWSLRQKVGVVGQICEPDKREVGSSTLPRPTGLRSAVPLGVTCCRAGSWDHQPYNRTPRRIQARGRPQVPP